MSTNDLKKSRRRKNKPKGDNTTAKLMNPIPSNLIERTMDSSKTSSSLFNISSNCNSFSPSVKCIVCEKETVNDKSLLDDGILPYDVSSSELPLYICNECRRSQATLTKSTNLTVTKADEIGDFLVESEATCGCLSHNDKNFRNLKNCHILQSDELLRQFSEFVKHVFKDGGVGWTNEKNHYELMLLDKLKLLIDRWCTTSSQDSFLWLQCQVKDYIEELKLNLLSNMKEHDLNVTRTTLFLNDLLEGYARFCCASKRLKSVVIELEKRYLKKTKLSWEEVNRRLFYSIVYADDRIQTLLPKLLDQLYQLNKADKEQLNVASILQKYFKWEEQMKNVAELCDDVESFFQECHKSQNLIRNKLRCVCDDADSITFKQKIEHHLIKSDSSGPNSPCEDCTLKYLLTYKVKPNTESTGSGSRSSLSNSPMCKCSYKSSMLSSADAAILKEQLRYCENVSGLPNGMKKVRREDILNLAQMCCAKNCSGHSMPCNNSKSSHLDPSEEREPGDGASENSVLLHSSKSYIDENFKDQCHTCSLVTNVGVDHVIETNDVSKDRSIFETPCECHFCVQHADRATIPSIINSPLPAALHLYPHIHGTNTEHSINSNFVKPILHSHVHEVYTSVSAAKSPSQDDASVKYVGKSQIHGSVMDSLKAECCKSKILQFSKTYTQSQDYKTLLTKENIETQKIIRRSTQTITTNVSVKTQTQDVAKSDESPCTKCVTKNKAVQATSNSCWPHLLDPRLKNHYNHKSTSFSGNGNCVKKDAEITNCINECRHSTAKSNIRPTTEESKNKSVHSCGHHNGHIHSNTSTNTVSKESRIGIRESQSLSPTRSGSDVEHLRSGDGEDCMDDSCSERSSSTSTSNTKDAKHCDCCYCEVFGHDVATIPSTNRHYTEYRDRLRQRLNRKKECKTLETVEPVISKKMPQEDDRDLESLINYINGDDDNDGNAFDNSPKKLPKLMKKLNKKLKKIDSLEQRIDEKDISLDIPERKFVGQLGEILSSCVDINHVPNCSKINNMNILLREKVKDDKIENVCKELDRSFYNNENRSQKLSVKNIDSNKIQTSRPITPPSGEVTHDIKKQHLANTSVNARSSIIENKAATTEKQITVPNFKLKKQLPYQNSSETLPSVQASSHIASMSTSFNTRSPSTGNDVQEWPGWARNTDKISKIKSGPNDQSPRKPKNSKDKKKIELVNDERSSKAPICIFSDSVDGLSTKFNGMRLEPESPCPSRSVSEQCQNRRAKKKRLPSDSRAPIDEVFIPRDIDLDNGELDETERELEEFKRFCWYSEPVPNEKKIRVNLKDLKLPKKTVECS